MPRKSVKGMGEDNSEVIRVRVPKGTHKKIFYVAMEECYKRRQVVGVADLIRETLHEKFGHVEVEV